MSKVNILIVEDHPSVREGLRSLLEDQPFTNTVYEAEDEHGFLHALNTYTIDIILLDMKLKGVHGLDLLPKLKDFARQPKVVALTGLEGEELIVNLLKAGINAVVHKLDHHEHILKAMTCALVMDTYFSKYITKVIQANKHRWDEVPSVTLSHQERAFVKGLADGLTNLQIAELFKMTDGSMKKFRNRLIKKTRVPNAAALLAFAYRNGIL